MFNADLSPGKVLRQVPGGQEISSSGTIDLMIPEEMDSGGQQGSGPDCVAFYHRGNVLDLFFPNKLFLVAGFSVPPD